MNHKDLLKLYQHSLQILAQNNFPLAQAPAILNLCELMTAQCKEIEKTIEEEADGKEVTTENK